jgi:hypothetical protein
MWFTIYIYIFTTFYARMITQGRNNVVVVFTTLQSVGLTTKGGAKGSSAIGRYKPFISRPSGVHELYW